MRSVSAPPSRLGSWLALPLAIVVLAFPPPAGFAAAVIERLNARTGLVFTRAASPFARMAGQDAAVECSANLRALALVLESGETLVL